MMQTNLECKEEKQDYKGNIRKLTLISLYFFVLQFILCSSHIALQEDVAV